MSISVIIITKDEEKNIARAVKSASFANEVLVVDDYSSDNTVSIAKEYGARIIQNVWEGYGQQKNIGRAHAQHEWLFFLDADEEITPPLAKEILAVIQNANADVYWVPVLDVFLGQPLNHLKGNNPRLFHKKAARWTQRHVHEQLELISTHQIITLGDDISSRLTAHIIHHGHATIKSYFKKMHRYTTLDARQMVETQAHRSGQQVKPSWFLAPKLAGKQFIKLWLYRRGVLDGFGGTLWALLSAYYEWEMAIKYRSMMRPTV